MTFTKEELKDALLADSTFNELEAEHGKIYSNYSLHIDRNKINYKKIANLSTDSFIVNSIDHLVQEFIAYFERMFSNLKIYKAVEFINYFLYLFLLQKTIVHETLDYPTKYSELQLNGEPLRPKRPGALFYIDFYSSSIIIKTFIANKNNEIVTCLGFKFPITINALNINEPVTFCVINKDNPDDRDAATVLPEDITKSFIEQRLIQFI